MFEQRLHRFAFIRPQSLRTDKVKNTKYFIGRLKIIRVGAKFIGKFGQDPDDLPSFGRFKLPDAVVGLHDLFRLDVGSPSGSRFIVHDTPDFPFVA